jgi:hypothetical protein
MQKDIDRQSMSTALAMGRQRRDTTTTTHLVPPEADKHLRTPVAHQRVVGRESHRLAEQRERTVPIAASLDRLQRDYEFKSAFALTFRGAQGGYVNKADKDAIGCKRGREEKSIPPRDCARARNVCEDEDRTHATWLKSAAVAR